MPLEINWNDEVIVLYEERAAFLPARGILILADPHFGKPATFRHAGIPVPRGVTQSDITRLNLIVGHSCARRVVVLGDFFHAKAGRDDESLEPLEQWIISRQCEFVVVKGNHDKHAGNPPTHWKVECVEGEWLEAGFAFRHAPIVRPKRPTFCGHVHPAYTMQDTTGTRLRAPCFLFGENLAVLPAYGSFTGMYDVDPVDGDRVFLVGEQVIEV